MSSSSVWTDDRVQILMNLWREGASASQIARTLGGVTRNAVIGKIHRLGLSGRARPSAPGARRARPKGERRIRRSPVGSPVRRLASPPPATPTSPALPETGLVGVVEVRRGQCRWPMGDPMADGFCLCGREAVRGAYCAAHGALAYRTPPRDHLMKLAGLW